MKWFDKIIALILQFGGMFFSLFGRDPRVKQIQDWTVKSCNFLPTAASVAAMLAASNPAVIGVVGIATAICRVVSSRPMSLGLLGSGEVASVNGVPVEGEFIK